MIDRIAALLALVVSAAAAALLAFALTADVAHAAAATPAPAPVAAPAPAAVHTYLSVGVDGTADVPPQYYGHAWHVGATEVDHGLCPTEDSCDHEYVDGVWWFWPIIP